ncbi:uracil-DNA glycosylase [Thermohalobacter berrensis]|uniref:Type-4 uracil-DNA glycosylase n=1 Tax=Thermohalobacter berrensis TaxID=99594 RepID=A0A419T014_9FIRM|nr:uracil-DNA glycosylase [Thermohalobacter berrensis]RKD30857.1 uracil-DNA glycosylase [Thermohalobacter berrensis]
MKQEAIAKLNKKLKDNFIEKELVFGNGNLDSKIILIGEAPGAKEVELKKPFVGQAGKYLEEFLNILELERKDIYITNVVKFRPTKASSKTGRKINRAPTKKEINQFKDYLIEEINIINPKIIVTLGNVPLKTLTDDNVSIGKVHGKNLNVIIKNNNEYLLYPLYHPAAVIYRKQLKQTYIDDLHNLKKVLKNI